MTKLLLLKEALENAMVIKMGKYEYFVNPTQGVLPPLKPELLKEIAQRIVELADFEVDKIVTIEAMGIHVSALVATMTNLPIIIARKKKFNLPGEIEVEVKKSYRKIAGKETGQKFYINSIKKGDRVIIIDDVMSTGGTVSGVIQGLKKVGVIVKDVIIVMNRGRGPEKVKRETGLGVKTLADVEIKNGRVHIIRID
ncbi:MAG: hypoxanthine/guanine phosphoribosyltransferase [Candidatus Hadarchaeaceae archaeon]